MSFPVLLFALFVVGGLLASGVGAWNLHARPVPVEAQRVTDAVLRAAASQAKISALPLGAATLLLALVGAYLGLDLPAQSPMILAPVLGAATGLGVVGLASRQLVNAAGQVASARSADRVTTASGLAASSSSLLSAAGGGALVSGMRLVSELSGHDGALVQVILLAAAGALVACAFVVSPLILAWRSAEGESPSLLQPLDPRSLARLIGQAFTASALRGSLIFGLSVVGHCALQSAASHNAEIAAEVMRFSQLTPLLGLLALLFAAGAQRTSEREPARSAWLRGGAVGFVVLVGGLWTVGAESAGEATAPTLAAISTFLLTAFGVAVWLASSSKKETADPAVLLIRTSPALGLIVLLPSLGMLALSLASGEQPLSAAEYLVVLVSVLLSILPLFGAWQMASDVLSASSTCQRLAHEGAGETTAVSTLRSDALPNPGILVLAVAFLCLLAVASLSLILPQGFSAPGASTLFLGGLLFGTLISHLIAADTDNRARRGARLVSEAIDAAESAAADGQPASLTAALDAARLAGGDGRWSMLGRLLVPFILLGLLTGLDALGGLHSFIFGMLAALQLSALVPRGQEGWPAARLTGAPGSHLQLVALAILCSTLAATTAVLPLP